MVGNIDAVKAMKSLYMHVSIFRTRELRLRLWLAKWLIRLAALVINCELEIYTGWKQRPIDRDNRNPTA